MSTSPSIVIPKSPESKALGSGHKYFDVTLPENNHTPEFGTTMQDKTPAQMLAHAAHIMTHTFFCNYDKELKKKIQDFTKLMIRDKSNHHLINHRFKHPHNSHYYENNRDTALLTVCMLTLRNMTEDDYALLKEMTTTLLASGLHPLEKCGRFGYTAFTHILNNTETSIDLLNFFAALHPEALTDLTEENDTAMNLLLKNNRSFSIISWVAENLPVSSLEENIKSIKPRLKKSKKAQSALELLTARLEKHLLETNLKLPSINKDEIDSSSSLAKSMSGKI